MMQQTGTTYNDLHFAVYSMVSALKLNFDEVLFDLMEICRRAEGGEEPIALPDRIPHPEWAVRPFEHLRSSSNAWLRSIATVLQRPVTVAGIVQLAFLAGVWKRVRLHSPASPGDAEAAAPLLSWPYANLPLEVGVQPVEPAALADALCEVAAFHKRQGELDTVVVHHDARCRGVPTKQLLQQQQQQQRPRLIRDAAIS